jgi:8-oxo-dGTP diphosphatase
MSDLQQITKTGIGVMVVRDGKVLLGKRKGSHGEGEYSFPGGHLEYMESFADCAKREVLEEAGLKINNIRFLTLTNLKKYAPKHYTDIGLLADWESGEPQVMEPNKTEFWKWVEINQLPRPLFGCIENYLESYSGGNKYFDN